MSPFLGFECVCLSVNKRVSATSENMEPRKVITILIKKCVSARNRESVGEPPKIFHYPLSKKAYKS